MLANFTQHWSSGALFCPGGASLCPLTEILNPNVYKSTLNVKISGQWLMSWFKTWHNATFKANLLISHPNSLTVCAIQYCTVARSLKHLVPLNLIVRCGKAIGTPFFKWTFGWTFRWTSKCSFWFIWTFTRIFQLSFRFLCMNLQWKSFSSEGSHEPSDEPFSSHEGLCEVSHKRPISDIESSSRNDV